MYIPNFIRRFLRFLGFNVKVYDLIITLKPGMMTALKHLAKLSNMTVEEYVKRVLRGETEELERSKVPKEKGGTLERTEPEQVDKT